MVAWSFFHLEVALLTKEFSSAHLFQASLMAAQLRRRDFSGGVGGVCRIQRTCEG